MLGRGALHILRIDAGGAYRFAISYAAMDRVRLAWTAEKRALDILHGEASTWLELGEATRAASSLQPFAWELIRRVEEVRAGHAPA